jgi:hypothetical protein
MSQIVPGKQALHIIRGSEFSFGPFEIDIDGTILNLAGATVLSQVRASKSRIADLIAEFTVAVTNGDDTGYPSDIELTLTDEETAALAQSGGWYDVLVIDVSNNDTYYLEGSVSIEGTVTVKP